MVLLRNVLPTIKATNFWYQVSPNCTNKGHQPCNHCINVDLFKYDVLNLYPA
jgi:hypothetical protein